MSQVYDNLDRPIEKVVNGETQFKYEYDANGNLASKEDLVNRQNFRYIYDLSDRLTEIKNGDHSFAKYSYDDNNNGSKISYTYDANGNIETITEGTKVTKYTYNELNEVTREDNGTLNKSIVYSYDAGGNIVSKTYGYAEDTTQYTLLGDKVIEEGNADGDDFKYNYDASGKLISMIFENQEYFYIRNGQSDIIGLLDKTGKQVVGYTYDSWGKLLSTTGSLKDTLGQKNPYRYRGYRYDSDTGLYYLNSRYYNPEWGRFINADGIVTTPGELLSGNMFAYCKNNPVNMKDPAEYRPILCGPGEEETPAMQIASARIMLESAKKRSYSSSRVKSSSSSSPKKSVRVSKPKKTYKHGLTTGVGGNFSIQFGHRFSFGFQYVKDGYGNRGICFTVGVGGGTPAGGLGGCVTVTNADTIYNLTGSGMDAGGSANLGFVPVAGGGDFVMSSSNGGVIGGI
ncbi:RHS repeat domain-containing protein [Inconstantimicrobium mannanitabidum]|uniref:Uncharacterized protein n=1 Tax=Inconstantimicrobium mannanitabidum TaxID=1604901 RepID=A0ACB5RHR9_9CLOT|nr:RHS repeat-associated core domain-containing protein [Clostridium sp. TW13]GKX68617.1 hypothetical protein rsdtw13_38750 [Clostridium sp. TW13]